MSISSGNTVHHRAITLLVTAGILLQAVGCGVTQPHHQAAKQATKCPLPADIPRELSKTTLPRYTVEPPDILSIEGLNIMPKMPYKLRAQDVVSIEVANPLPNQPLAGNFAIEPGGKVNLGATYGSVIIAGMSPDEAQAELVKHLKNTIKDPEVVLSIVQMAGLQQIAGQHLVSPDGTITLGTYGSVEVTGLTLAQVKLAVEHHLSKDLEKPEVAVDVFAYNSRSYYVITEGGGLGDSVTKFPVTGNETVLDAIANVNGMTQVSSKKIWIARAVPHAQEVTILPVDWSQVAGGGIAATNYQIIPGDRIFIAEDSFVAMDSHLGKFMAPFERIFGFSLLGVGTVTRFSGPVLRGGGNPQNGNNGGGGGF